MKYLVFLLTFASFTVVLAQKSEFDALLNAHYPSDEPGGTVIVAKEGEIIYHKAFGMANMELNVPMRREMVFQIGSITKQFTAISVLMLMEEGKLGLGDDITKFIPGYPTHGHEITVHHLLTHTSGIKSYTNKEEWYNTWRDDMTPLEMIDFFKNDSMDFAPGENWEYNNSAYFILGYIIEVVSGQTYEDFVEQRIFKPLGMKNSRYGINSEIVQNRAYGYQPNDASGYVNAEYLSMTQPYAAGSLMSTVEDLYIWNTALHAGKLVKEETLKLAFTDYKTKGEIDTGYGYGWALNDVNGSPAYEHSGGIFGFVTNALYLPEEDVFVAAFSNCNCHLPMKISTKIAAIAIDKPYPTKDQEVKVNKKHLNKWTGVYEFLDNGTLFEITTDEKRLIIREEGEGIDTLYALSKNTFIYPDNMGQLIFEEEKDTVSVTYWYRLFNQKAIETDKKMPSVKLDETILKNYTGTFTVGGKFEIELYIDEGELMAKMEGQDPVKLTPLSETIFTVEEMDAEIVFIPNSSGKYNRISFHQGILQMQATRK